mmetsp:Transcript_3984/g.7298  ORF Transcript_3984/g.7298 Transcript_3984/m.7298 type:complete len:286 (+) Transcript_3984:116-973(+)
MYMNLLLAICLAGGIALVAYACGGSQRLRLWMSKREYFCAYRRYKLTLYPWIEGPGSAVDVGDKAFGISTQRRSEFSRGKVVESTTDRVKVVCENARHSGWFKRIRVVPDLSTQTDAIIVCCETWHYRRLVCEVLKGDTVLEIGCDMGSTTSLLAARAGPQFVVGIDKSKGSVEIASKRHPGINFVHCDLKLDGSGLLELSKGLRRKMNSRSNVERPLFDKVFIDINGIRPLKDVKQLLHSVMQQLRPRLIIVKSVHFYNEQMQRFVNSGKLLGDRRWQLERHRQ